MRGEVLMLNRNIIIQGDQTLSDWYGQFVTSDAIQIDANGNETTLQGLTVLDNVEFTKMGQNNTEKSAIRFERSNIPDTATEFSSVSNCAFHDSGTMAVFIYFSRNINFSNCDIFFTRQIGVVIDTSTKVNFDSVNVINVYQRGMANSDMADREACVAIGTWHEYVPCYQVSFTNSIVAGCPFAGLIAHGYSCNDTVGSSKSSVVKNVVAHSIHGSGFSIIPDVAIYNDSIKCFQMSHLSAYKNDQAGIGVAYKSDEVRATNIVLVDNQLGIILSLTNDENDKIIKLTDSFIFGEASDLAKDCPDGTTGTTGAECYCPDKFGFMSFYALDHAKDAHIVEKAARPVYNTKALGAWSAKAIITNVQFKNF